MKFKVLTCNKPNLSKICLNTQIMSDSKTKLLSITNWHIITQVLITTFKIFKFFYVLYSYVIIP